MANPFDGIVNPDIGCKLHMEDIEVIENQTNFSSALESLDTIAESDGKFIVIDNTYLPSTGARPHGSLTAQY